MVIIVSLDLEWYKGIDKPIQAVETLDVPDVEHSIIEVCFTFTAGQGLVGILQLGEEVFVDNM